MQTDASKLILEEHKRKIADAPSMNFIALIQLWREMACYYRKIAKDIPYRRSSGNAPTAPSSGFRYSDDVPGFYLDGNLEDTAWSFERITRYCPVNNRMQENIRNNQLITVWDLCLATGLNCKEGVHYDDEHICEDNFLKGSCSCPSKESLETAEAELQIKKIELTTQLTQMISNETSNDSSEWVSTKSKKPKSKQTDPVGKLKNEIAKLDEEINQVQSIQRKIHYTEQGMIPFETQLVNWKLAEEAKKLEVVPEVQKAAPKATWDHNVASLVDNAPKAIKITKLGGKKK